MAQRLHSAKINSGSLKKVSSVPKLRQLLHSGSIKYYISVPNLRQSANFEEPFGTGPHSAKMHSHSFYTDSSTPNLRQSANF